MIPIQQTLSIEILDLLAILPLSVHHGVRHRSVASIPKMYLCSTDDLFAASI